MTGNCGCPAHYPSAQEAESGRLGESWLAWVANQWILSSARHCKMEGNQKMTPNDNLRPWNTWPHMCPHTCSPTHENTNTPTHIQVNACKLISQVCYTKGKQQSCLLKKSLRKVKYSRVRLQMPVIPAWQVGERGFLTLRSVWTMEWVSGHPRLQAETLSKDEAKQVARMR